MKFFRPIALVLCNLLMAACASNPAPESGVRSQAEVLQKMQQIQAQKQTQQVVKQAPEKKSIVPDINEKGHRGDMARKMMDRTAALFLEADVDQDYQISVEEAGRRLPHVSKDFPRYDKNGDGNVSWQELLGHDRWPAPAH